MGKFKEFMTNFSLSESIIQTNKEIRKALQERQQQPQETSPQEDLFCALCQATGGVEKVMLVLVENLKKDLAKKEGMVQILDDYPDEQQKMREDIQNYQDLIRLHKEIMGNEQRGEKGDGNIPNQQTK